MKQGLKITIIVAATAILTFVATAYLVRRNMLIASINTFGGMEATNQVGVVEAYDRIEGLLTKGCNKEALETVHIERSQLLSVLQYQISTNKEIMRQVRQRNPEVADRALKATHKAVTYLPECK